MNKEIPERIVMRALLAGVFVATQFGAAQTESSDLPASRGEQQSGTSAPNDSSAIRANAASPALVEARVFALDQMPIRQTANGGESRSIVHGILATGETVSLHQSMQVVGATPNPPHVIHHSEFILIREGQVEFQHEIGGKMVADKAGAGDVIYVAYGTRHSLKNIGAMPAEYYVIGIGGDAK
jgi:mannose-6-phosphate isomerase-like protein (cupin superfamily)